MVSAQYGLVGGVNPNRNVGYNWDYQGNRTSVVDTGVTTTYTQNATADALNQYTTVGAASVSNGVNHEITAYAGVAYQYINDGRLTHVTSGPNVYDIKYDALGRAVKRTLNQSTTYYFYDGEKAINETGAALASNLYGLGIDEIVIRYTSSNIFYYYQDHEGSVTHVLSATSASESYRYDAFGQPGRS